MQPFVEEFIKKKQAEWKEAYGESAAAEEEKRRRERDERLIRLGMCEKEYNPSTVYSEDYPLEEYKTGRFYRLVPYTVSEEEYAAICRYDDTTTALRPANAEEGLFPTAGRAARVLPVLRLILGVAVSFLSGVLLYLADSRYFPVSVLIALLGSAFAYFGALSLSLARRAEERTRYLVALAEKKERMTEDGKHE